jgi:spermidine/putrescine transport system substrate-binding protein
MRRRPNPNIQEDDMKKKSVLTAVLAMAALMLASCGKTPSLYIYNWTYYIPDDVLRSFEKKFNCKVVYEEFDSNEAMYQKISAGGSGYDVVYPGADYAQLLAQNGMLEPLDHSKLPNIANIDPGISAKKTFDPDNKWCVPYFMGAAGIMVNKEKVKDYKRSWSIFEREDLKGKMTLQDDIRETFGAALKYAGLSGNATSPADLAKASEILKVWKKNIVNFDSTTYGESFVAGDLWVVHAYAEVIYLILSEGQVDNEKYADKYEFFIPDEGNVAFMDTMAILKDSKNKKLAHAFINYIHDPKVNARIADFTRYPCINLKARPLVTAKPNYTLEQVLKCELKVDVGQALQLYSDAWEDLRIDG